MCSLFLVPRIIDHNNTTTNNNNMEPDFQGDLTDILRASSGSANNTSSGGYGDLLGLPNNYLNNTNTNNWQSFSSGDHAHGHHMMSDHHSFPSSLLLEDHQTLVPAGDAFGDPFSHARDPLLHAPTAVIDAGFYGALDEDGGGAKLRPAAAAGCNMFSRMLQISHPVAGAKSAEAAHSPRTIIKVGEGDGGSDGVGGGGVQISSPRNPGGIKRRKSQAKKVVCIPAPAAANSRASGEVVPSDLWAWRKYGQKPIKGSPYPRGYYRCSSSKGCSARKQVERSRTDPNMLVITYTSEHNHPWPTQRNALAGSTRSQPTKTSNNASSKSSPISPQSHHHHSIQKNITSPKEEQKPEKIMISNNNASTSTTSASVKEENVDHENTNNNTNTNSIEKQIIESLDDSAFSGGTPDQVGFGFRPVNDQDFFADLGEIEADPLNLLFTQAGFSNSSSTHDHHQNHHKDNNNDDNSKGLDPFSLFDWSEGNNNNNNNKQRE